MPPLKTSKPDLPETLRVYDYYKLLFNYREGLKDVQSDCPFCGRSEKFGINVKNGLWRCLICNSGSDNGKVYRGGNAATFVKSLHHLAKDVCIDKGTEETRTRYKQLAEDRGLLNYNTLMTWEIVRSPLSAEWVIPAYNPDKVLCNLYRYVNLKGKDGKYKHRVLNSPLPQQIFGMNLWDSTKQTVYVCEGIWDAMVLYEVLCGLKQTEGGYAPTGSIKNSLYNTANIIAFPGCNVFNERWTQLFEGKHVIFLFDNDHPKINPATKQLSPPASYMGVQRITDFLTSSIKPPASISYLEWGPNGFDPSLSSGKDLRDIFTEAGDTLGSRISGLKFISERITGVPSTWLKSEAGASKRGGSKSGETLPCDNWKDLINSWRKAMRWIDGLDHALCCMLATVVSTMRAGDQLWMKIIGPASCGKTTLGQALTLSEHIVVRDVIRGFTSGWRQEDGSTFDLASEVHGKTMLTLDGDTLIQSSNLGNILSEGRRLFDGSMSSHFKNGSGKDIVNHRFTWLLFGTSSLRSIDSSELGERFLDCVVMEGIDDELEDEILTRVANRVARNMELDISQVKGSSDEPDMAQAKAMTSGYVNHLRDNVNELMRRVSFSDEALHYCTRLGKFVAFMRARPSELQDESADREFAARLVSQHLRLAKCLAVVLNKTTVDLDVLKRTRKVALDTSRGKTTEIARYLYEAGLAGLEPKSIALYTTQKESEIRKLLKFLQQIGVTQVYLKKTAKGINPKPTWVLTDRMKKLWKEVHQL